MWTCCRSSFRIWCIRLNWWRRFLWLQLFEVSPYNDRKHIHSTRSGSCTQNVIFFNFSFLKFFFSYCSSLVQFRLKYRCQGFRQSPQGSGSRDQVEGGYWNSFDLFWFELYNYRYQSCRHVSWVFELPSERLVGEWAIVGRLVRLSLDLRVWRGNGKGSGRPELFVPIFKFLF